MLKFYSACEVKVIAIIGIKSLQPITHRTIIGEGGEAMGETTRIIYSSIKSTI